MVIILGCCIVFITMKPKQSLIPIWLLCAAMLQAATLQAATTVTNIAAGAYFSLFLETDSNLWVMGFNSNSAVRPEQLVSNGVVAIAAGFTHILFLKSDGSLWGMGNNLSGQLGVGPSEVPAPEEIVSNGVIAIAAGSDDSLFLKSNGSLWAMGLTTTNGPEQIVSNGVVAISGGLAHTLFIESDGSLWGMGINSFGQLGNGTTDDLDRPQEIVASNVVAIAAGGAHSLFVETNGSLWAMGLNQDGQLGDGTTNNASRPEQIVSNGVVAVAAGLYHSLFLKSDGSLWAMGLNGWGQLGDGTSGYMNYTNRPEKIIPSGVVAVAAGNDHSLLRKSDGSLWGMGASYGGQLGDGFTNRLSWISSLPEKIVPSPQPVFTSAIILPNNNLQLSATCFFGGNYLTLAGTNLSQSLEQWMLVGTNSVTMRGTNNFIATLTNVVNSGAAPQFYLLQSQ